MIVAEAAVLAVDEAADTILSTAADPLTGDTGLVSNSCILLFLPMM